MEGNTKLDIFDLQKKINFLINRFEMSFLTNAKNIDENFLENLQGKGEQLLGCAENSFIIPRLYIEVRRFSGLNDYDICLKISFEFSEEFWKDIKDIGMSSENRQIQIFLRQ